MRALNRIQKVEAVIISHREYGEADRLLRVFTPRNGKITILAKGARKSGSHKAPHIQPFAHCALVVAKGQNFWILTQADTIHHFQGIHEDLSKTGLAAYLLELADRLTIDDQPDAALFRTIVEAMRHIDSSENPFVPFIYYELRLLDLTGFRPDLFHCVSCHKEIRAEDQYFSASHGGAICPECGHFEQNLLPAPQATLKYLRHFQRSNFTAIMSLEIARPAQKELRKIMDAYVSSVTERRLNSPEFIQQIRRLNGEE